MTLAKAFGVRIAVSNILLVLLLVYIWAGLALEVLIVFAIVVIHELSHAFVAHRFGIELTEVELLPFGGVARFAELIELDPATEVAVAAAGPASSILLGLVAHLASMGLGQFKDVLRFAADSSFMVAAFNILPILPLDGGRILRAWLGYRLGLKDATIAASNLGLALALLLGVFSLAALFYGWLNLTAFFVFLFLCYATIRERHAVPYLHSRQLVRKMGELKRRRVMEVVSLAVMPDTPVKAVLDRLLPGRYHLVFVLDGSGAAIGVLPEDAVIAGAVKYGIHVEIGRLL